MYSRKRMAVELALSSIWCLFVVLRICWINLTSNLRISHGEKVHSPMDSNGIHDQRQQWKRLCVERLPIKCYIIVLVAIAAQHNLQSIFCLVCVFFLRADKSVRLWVRPVHLFLCAYFLLSLSLFLFYRVAWHLN